MHAIPGASRHQRSASKCGPDALGIGGKWENYRVPRQRHPLFGTASHATTRRAHPPEASRATHLVFASSSAVIRRGLSRLPNCRRIFS